MKVEFELQLPSVPNYILINNRVVRPRGEERPKVSITDLSVETLREIGAKWTEELLKKAGKWKE